MIIPRLIERKRDGAALTAEEWRALIASYVAGEMPDYQMAALAMAVYFRGLEPAELVALTEAMVGSGERLRLGSLPWPRVDKHSIGGVGDKTSLILAPLLAASGVAVPMISGRGLGHTGGTLDKLEAIPGFNTRLSLRQATRQMERLGVVMVGQTPELVPADRKLYGLRDVTGTVESIPLISASIMSKKLVEDLNGLVLDIKTGSGAFITDPEQSLVLARTMIELGHAHGCRTVGLLTAMDRPLGWACGNALEVIEAVETLQGGGPPDLLEVTLALGVEMLLVAGVESDRDQARLRLQRVLESGAAWIKFVDLVKEQGGDVRAVEATDRLPAAPAIRPYLAQADGVVREIAPRVIGEAIVALGGGRRRAEDSVDPSVGFRIVVKPGDRVRRGMILAEVHARNGAEGELAAAALDRAIVLGPGASPRPLVSHRVTIDGVERLAPSKNA
jgi:pyrimidine-nucleoside phosphorylase